MAAIGVDISGDHKAVAFRMGVHDKPIIYTTTDWTLDVMAEGMASGATSLMLMIPVTVPLQDIGVDNADALVLAEMSLTCWMMATAVLAEHCKAEVEKPGWASLSTAAVDLLIPRYAEAIRRAIPSATAAQADEAAAMMISAMGDVA